MQSKLHRRLNGSYQKVRRDRHLLYREHKMTDPECRLWELLVSLCDWDPKHFDTVGTVEATQKELAGFLGREWSTSKVSRTKDLLINKGVLTEIEQGIFRIVPSPLVREPLAPTQYEIASTHSSLASVQVAPDKDRRFSIVSYKGEYKPYQRKEADHARFTEDDAEWIKLNETSPAMKTKAAVELSDRDFAEVFFDGNMELYRQHCTEKI